MPGPECATNIILTNYSENYLTHFARVLRPDFSLRRTKHSLSASDSVNGNVKEAISPETAGDSCSSLVPSDRVIVREVRRLALSAN